MTALLFSVAWWYLLWAAGLIVGFVLLCAFWFARQAIQDRDARRRIAMFTDWERML